MKKPTKKLTLSKDTLRSLNETELKQVAGGAPTSVVACTGTDPTEATVCYTNALCSTGEAFGCCF
ncbi:hypothetical protein COCOR_03657 [Corallococcus coralloides DSM 2259]|uniref:Uncharacterized protein n=1 Tax=Corallococcus coralloides (strain ATCC 25202 / DSM 2259 / NBRC 100086 / M2) TaxID=1144275 RepID=H8MNE3_CORCM|nr:class I lanthipeptide [Corallococcus coralloides]AFE05364.1 hypothetical protein COCOR_03657 [Corallococcus coralloides DSM 2259]